MHFGLTVGAKAQGLTDLLT
uniref:Uncharacterized protein n=1 Tax=Anguilla anguilla TaxID=7936 RepID=A0A0E9REW6_ANGAN